MFSAFLGSQRSLVYFLRFFEKNKNFFREKNRKNNFDLPRFCVLSPSHKHHFKTKFFQNRLGISCKRYKIFSVILFFFRKKCRKCYRPGRGFYFTSEVSNDILDTQAICQAKKKRIYFCRRITLCNLTNKKINKTRQGNRTWK